MADFAPIKLHDSELQRFQAGDTVGIQHGGTGAATAVAARTALGLAIGVDVQAHSATLAGLSNWSSPGILVSDGTGGWVARQIATASSGRITVSNPTGVAGNVTLDLATVGSAQANGFYKIAYDAYGRVTGSSPVTVTDISGLVDSRYVRAAGDTMTGPLTLSGDPTNANHAANKAYVDAVMASGGIAPFPEARVKTTGNITLSGLQTVDGVALVAGNRVLVSNQTTASQNGIYVAATGAWTRAADANEPAEFAPARTVFIQEGNLNSRTSWAVSSAANPVIGTSPISFVQTSGANQYTNGNGLTLDGNQFSVLAVSGQLVVTGSGVGLATSGVTPGEYTKVTVDSFGRVTSGGAATPADIGAQPQSAALTALAAMATSGLMVRTGTNTYTARTITGTTGRVTVSNGNGASGNPTIDLNTSGVTAGTYNSVTVDVYGRVTAGTTVAMNELEETVTNGETAAIAIGRVVYISGANTVRLANANNITTAKSFGMVFQPTIAAGAAGRVAMTGIVEATTGQWDTATGQTGGLTVGAQYYLSNTVAGRMTTTAPESGVNAPIGIALSSTKFKLDIQRVVIL